MKKIYQITAVFVAMAVVFTGCTDGRAGSAQYQAESTKDAPKEDVPEYKVKLAKITPDAYSEIEGIQLEPGSYISVVGKAGNTEFWSEVKKGAAKAEEDFNKALGYKGDDKVKVGYHAPDSAEDVDGQVNLLDEELALYPAAVSISIVDKQACDVQFDLALENNIPIVSFDSGSNYKGIVAMVSTDNTATAKECAKRMADNLASGGDVIVISPEDQSECIQTRTAVFCQELQENHPNVKVVNTYYLSKIKKAIADEVNAGTYALGGEEPTQLPLAEEDKITEDKVQQDDVLEYIYKKNPTVRGIYATTAETMRAALQMQEKEKMQDIKIVGYDIDETIQKSIEDGTVTGVIVQNPYGMGYASVIAAARATLDMGNEAYVDTGYEWVDADTLKDENIQKFIY